MWTKALSMPAVSNILVALGIYALEQLVQYLRAHPKHDFSYQSPGPFIEIGV